MATAKNEKNTKHKVRGTATYDGDDFTFTPTGTGEAQQHNIVSSGKNKMYETTGKRNSIVAHLVCDGSSTDPASEMIDSLQKMCEKMKKPFPTVNVKDIDIINYDNIKVRASRPERKVKIYMDLPLAKPQAVYKQLSLLMAKLSAELYLSEDKIQKLNN